jgi:predicted acetyltransferase
MYGTWRNSSSFADAADTELEQELCMRLWEVRVAPKNTAAQMFWSRTIASFMGIAVEASAKGIEDKSWNVFSFDTEERKVN